MAMAANIPAKLRAADLTRYIVRAAQLETAKPVISYWCAYWIVNQVLAKGLQNDDQEVFQYTLNLMDKLEQVKADNATNDAILDDTAGQAYVEHFGLETFFRADRAVKANAVTKQTADTFQAAATFLELLNIWGAPETDTAAKIKYAKWNAIRIMRALKEGKDPNESNPKIESADVELPALDPNDPEVLRIGGQNKPQPASVEDDVPDGQLQVGPSLGRQFYVDQSLHPSAQPSAQLSAPESPRKNPAYEPYPKDGFPYTAVRDEKISPLEPSPNERDGSVGGGYFPEVPTFTSETQESTRQTAPSTDAIDLGLPDQPSAPPGSRIGLPGHPTGFPGVQRSPDFESSPPPFIPDKAAPPPQDFYRQAPPSHANPQFPPPPHQPHFAHPAAGQQPTNQSHPQKDNPPPLSDLPATKGQLTTDDISIAKAQKHCRWAISALNFEDAATAVKELREALKTLGAE